MAYLGLSPEPYFKSDCAEYCEWSAARAEALSQGGFVTMEFRERPPGCTCPGEDAQPTSIYKMTPQEIERYVKSSQGASGSGYWLMVAAIAALLLMYR